MLLRKTSNNVRPGILDTWPCKTYSKLSMEKEGLWDADERWNLAIGGVEGVVVDRMKESMGIVAEDGNVELQ